MTGSIGPVRPSGRTPPDYGKVVERVGQAIGLFAGVATLVYITGGAILALRLALAGLPWQPVVGQLPREFLISIGVSQVLLPAAVVGAAYAWLRLTVRQSPPGIRPWRERANREENRRRFLRQTVGWTAVLFLPAAIVIGWQLYRDTGTDWLELMFFLLGGAGIGGAIGDTVFDLARSRLRRGPPGQRETWAIGGIIVGVALVLAGQLLLYSSDDPKLLWLIALFVVTFLTAATIVEVRGRLARRGERSWRSLSSAALMTGVYAAAVIPTAVGIFGVAPFNDANLCSVDGFSERGDLIGQTSDRVYLGEEVRSPRRIAVFPTAQVEELFIGDEAANTQCDPRLPQGAVTADLRADEVERAALDTERAYQEFVDAATMEAALAAARSAGDGALAAAGMGRDTGDIVDRSLHHQAALIWRAADRAGDSGLRLLENHERIVRRSPGNRPEHRDGLEQLVANARRDTQAAAQSAREGSRELFREAKRAAGG